MNSANEMSLAMINPGQTISRVRGGATQTPLRPSKNKSSLMGSGQTIIALSPGLAFFTRSTYP